MSEQFDHTRFQRRLTAILNRSLLRLNVSRDAAVAYRLTSLMKAFQIKHKHQPTGNNANQSISLLKKTSTHLKEKKAQGIVPYEPSASLFMNHEEYVTLMKTRGCNVDSESTDAKQEEEQLTMELKLVESDLAWIISNYEQVEHRTNYDQNVKGIIDSKRKSVKESLGLFGLKMFFSTISQMLSHLPQIANSSYAAANLQLMATNLNNYTQSLCLQNTPIHIFATHQIAESLIPAIHKAMAQVKNLSIKIELLNVILSLLRVSPTCANWSFFLSFLKENQKDLNLSGQASLMKKITDTMHHFTSQISQFHAQPKETPELGQLVTNEKIIAPLTKEKELDTEFNEHKDTEVVTDGTYFYYLTKGVLYIIGTGYHGSLLGEVYEKIKNLDKNSTMCIFKGYILVAGMKKEDYKIIPFYGREIVEEEVKEIEAQLKKTKALTMDKRSTLFKIQAVGEELHFFFSANANNYTSDSRRLRWEMYDKSGKRKQDRRFTNKSGSNIMISGSERKNWRFFCQGDMIIVQQFLANNRSKLFIYEGDKSTPKVEVELDGRFQCIDQYNHCLWNFSTDAIDVKDQIFQSFIVFEKVWNPALIRSYQFSGQQDGLIRAQIQDASREVRTACYSSPSYHSMIEFLILEMANYFEQKCIYSSLQSYMNTQGLLTGIFQPFGDYSSGLVNFIIKDLETRFTDALHASPLIAYCDMLILNHLINRAIRFKMYKNVRAIVSQGLYNKLLQILLSPQKFESYIYGELLNQIEEFIAVNLIRLHILGQIEEVNKWKVAEQVLFKIAGNASSPKTDRKLRLIDRILEQAALSLNTVNIEMGKAFLSLSLKIISGTFSVALRTLNQKVIKQAHGAIVFVNDFVSILMSALYYKETELKKALFQDVLRGYLELTSELLQIGFKAAKVVNNEEDVIRILRYSRVVGNLNVIIRYYKINKIDLNAIVGLVLPLLEVKACLDRFNDKEGVFTELSDSIGWLIGRIFEGLLEAKHIQKMPKPSLFDQQMELDQRVALVETVQYLLSSKLFSGGIKLKKIGQLSQEFMDKIKSLGIFNDASLELVEPVLVSQGSYEEGSKLEGLINPGLDQTVDQFLNALQNELIKVDPRARVGGKSGEKLTRFAFAGMLKFSGLLGDFETLMNEISMGLYSANDLGTIRQQNSQIMKKFESKWATASEMRAWLQSQKKDFAEKGESDQYLSKMEKNLVNKVQQRIEFLLRFEQPEIWDLQEQKEGEDADNDAPILVRAQSSADKSRSESTEVQPIAGEEPKLVAQHSSSSLRKNSYSGVILHHSEEDQESLQSKIEYWTHKIKDWKLIQRSKGLVKNFQIRQREMFSSLTTSVLAYLQADIPVNIIQHQIHLNYLIICERIFVFQQLYHFLHENKDIEFGRFKKILNRYLSYFKQDGGPKHFLRGLKGYGQEIASILQQRFFEVIDVVIEQLHNTKNAADCEVMVEFLNWNYSARDHKDVLKRGIFSSLVGSRSSFLTNFWLNQEILDLSAQNKAILPLIDVRNNEQFANKLYSTFFEMAEQIVIRALNTKQGGLESTTSLTSSSSSLKMPSLDRYQSSIDQNSTESLLNWILNFTTVQIIKMSKLLQNYEIYLLSEIKKQREEKELAKKEKEKPKQTSQKPPADQTQHHQIRSLFESGSEEQYEDQPQNREEIKEPQAKQNEKEAEIGAPQLNLQSKSKPNISRSQLFSFFRIYLSKLCCFFQKISLLVEKQEQSLPFQCLLKYIAPKFISAMIVIFIRCPEHDTRINILGCFSQMLKIFPVQMFHEAVRLTLQKEEISAFLFSNQNIELKLLTSSLFTVIYKYAVKFYYYYSQHAKNFEKHFCERTLASIKEFLRFYLVQISNDQFDNLEEQVNKLDLEKVEQARELILILQILGGSLRSFSVGQEVFVRRYQDIPLEKKGFILKVRNQKEILTAQQFIVLVETDCISCRVQQLELVHQSSSTKLAKLLRFRQSLLKTIATHSRNLKEKLQAENVDAIWYLILTRILKLFKVALDSDSDYVGKELQEVLSAQILTITREVSQNRTVFLQHYASGQAFEQIMTQKPLSSRICKPEVSYVPPLIDCIESLQDLTSKFILVKHQAVQHFFPQLQIKKIKIAPHIQNSLKLVHLYQKLLSQTFMKIFLRDETFRSQFLSSQEHILFLLTHLYEEFKSLCQCPNYEPQSLEQLMNVYNKLSLSTKEVIPFLIRSFCSDQWNQEYIRYSIVLVGHFLTFQDPAVCYRKMQGTYFFYALLANIMKLADYPFHALFHRGFLHETIANLFDYLLVHSKEILSDVQFCHNFSSLYPKKDYTHKCLQIQEKLGQLADPIYLIWTELIRYFIIVHYRIHFKYPFLNMPSQWITNANSKTIRKFLLCVDSEEEGLTYQSEWDSQVKKRAKDLQFYAYDCIDKIVFNHADYAQFNIVNLGQFLGGGYTCRLELTRAQQKDQELEPNMTSTTIVQEGGSIEQLKLHKKSKLLLQIQNGQDKNFSERSGLKICVPDYNLPQIVNHGIKKIKLSEDMLVVLTENRDLYIGWACFSYKLYLLYKGIDNLSIVSSALILASSDRKLLQLRVGSSVRVISKPPEYNIPEIEKPFQILTFTSGKFALYNEKHLVVGRIQNTIEIDHIYDSLPGTVIMQEADDLYIIEETWNIYIFESLAMNDPICLRAPQAGVKRLFSLKNQKYVALLENGKIFVKYKDGVWEPVLINLFEEEARIRELNYDKVETLFYAYENVLEEQYLKRIEMKEMSGELFEKKPKVTGKGKPSKGLLEWKKEMMKKKTEGLETNKKLQSEPKNQEKKIEIEEEKVISEPQSQNYTWVYRLSIENYIQTSFYDKIDKQFRLKDYKIHNGAILRVLERKEIPQIKERNLDTLLNLTPDEHFDYIFSYQIEKNKELLEDPSLISKIKEGLNLQEKSQEWLYHCMCCDFNRDYNFTLSEKQFQAYKGEIFQTLPFIFIRSRHRMRDASQSLIKLYQFYNSKAIGKEQMQYVKPVLPMFEIFKEPRYESSKEEEKKQKKKDYSKLDTELHAWIVKAFDKGRFRISGSVTLDAGFRAISKGFNTLSDDLGKGITEGFSQLELEQRARTIFFRSHRCANLLSFVNFASASKMPDSSITGIVYKKKLPETMFFYKQAFLRALMAGAKRGNSLGTITLDRFMAHSFARRGIQDTTGSVTVFGQVMNKIDSKSERYTSLLMNRSSQNPWEVRFAGEKGIDAGGLTRESFDELSSELQSPQLPLLIKTPNNRNEYGEQREKWILNPSSRSMRELEMFRFLGGMLASSIRGERKMILDLAGLVYKKLLNLEVTDGDLKNVDNYCVKSLEDIQNLIKEGGLNIEDLFEEKFITCLSNGDEVELMEGGGDLLLTNDNVSQYEALVKAARKNESDFQMKALKAGFEIVLDPCYINYFTPHEIEILICGSSEITTADFQAISENPFSSPMKKMFWEVFEELSQEYRAKYLRFAWGRSRLPHAGESISDRHKLHGAGGSKPDSRLPVGHTCFFSVDMPNYSTKEIMKERLLYTLNNCQAIDGDGGSFVAFFDDEM